MKSWKRETVEGIEFQNQENIRILGEKENDMYLGILEEDSIKERKIKEKKDALKRTKEKNS